MSEMSWHRFISLTRLAALAGGVLALVSVVFVLGGETAQGEDFMGSAAAVAAGWMSFLGAALLVVGLCGIAARYAGQLPASGSTALGILVLATAVTVGAAATLALVVPVLVDQLPGIVSDPPAVIPATFIGSGLVMGISGIVLALALRRNVAGLRPWMTTLFIVASVVAMAPLPSRFFLLSFAVAVLLGTRVPATVGNAAPSRPEHLVG